MPSFSISHKSLFLLFVLFKKNVSVSLQIFKISIQQLFRRNKRSKPTRKYRLLFLLQKSLYLRIIIELSLIHI